MTDMVGSRTLRSQWDETVRCYGRDTFLEYVSVRSEEHTSELQSH